MENFYGQKFPSCLKVILTKSGYDNNYAFEAICEDNVVKIENFVNENKHIVKKTVYEKSVPFKFLPGHRAIILDLPRKIAEFKNKQANKQTETSTVSSELNPDREEELKNLLINKLINYSKYVKFELKFNKTHLCEFKKIGDKVKCRVKCPICPKNYLCNYKTHWSVSNIEAHIREHSLKNSAQQPTFQATSSSNSPASILQPSLVLGLVPTSLSASELVNTGKNASETVPKTVHRVSNEQLETLNRMLQKK